MNEWSSCTNDSMAVCFPEKSSWLWNEQEVKCRALNGDKDWIPCYIRMYLYSLLFCTSLMHSVADACSVASTDSAPTASTGTTAHYQDNRAADGNFVYTYPTPMPSEVLMTDNTRGGNTIDNLSRLGVHSSCFDFSVHTFFIMHVFC